MMVVIVLFLGFRVWSLVYGFFGRGGFVRKFLILVLVSSLMLVEVLGLLKLYASMVFMVLVFGLNLLLFFADSLRFFFCVVFEFGKVCI